jgi:DNA polymerase (family X)
MTIAIGSETLGLSNGEIADRLALASEAGVKVAISTDAHSTREFGAVRYGIEQARRAGLEPASVLNCSPWPSLEPLFRR